MAAAQPTQEPSLTGGNVGFTIRPELLARPPDLDGEPWYHRSLFDAQLLKLLKDPRDLGGARMMLRFAILLPIAAGLLYVDAFRTWWATTIYLLFVMRFLDRFILGMHVHLHRSWFHNKMLNKVMPNFVGIFFGQSFWTYWAHHLAMHHPEDNEPNDLSTTQPFQRDNGWHLLRYLVVFVTIGIPQLIVYFFKKGRPEIGRLVIMGELASWVLIGGLALISWQASVIVFVVPIAAARFLMMLGNWGQHSFVQPDGDVIHTLGTTLLNNTHNRRCFNNGYHALHHARQAMHWSAMPEAFDKLHDKYAAAGSVVFDGVPTFQVVTLALCFGQYAYLERHLVRFEGDERSAEERIEWLRERTRPYFPAPGHSAEAAAA